MEMDEAMTLAIAVKYPFGKLSDALVSLSRIRRVQYRQAIIFITDSRWSYDNPEMFEDVGAKVFTVDNSTVMAYSGDVLAAENCIEALTKKIANPHIRRVDVISVLKRTYKHHLQNRKGVMRVLFLLGKYLRTGEVKLFFLESPEFVYQEIQGIKGIGNQNAWNDVINKVAPVINDVSMYSLGEKDYMTIAVHFMSAMHELGQYKDIGGPIQYRILDSKGVSTSSISFTSDPTGKTDDWHQVTAGADDITTFKKRWNLNPDYLTRKAFGLYSHCD